MGIESISKIKIKRDNLDKIIAQAKNELPNECCGYLSTKSISEEGEVIVEVIYPLTNKDQSPTHFTFYPKEQFSTVKSARESGLNLFGVYHSHPETPARMSDEDLALAFDENIIYVIYSLINKEIHGYRVKDHNVLNQIPVEVFDE